uniref:C-type lectin domain-containing protein n=1 Tax=Caenorhabditis tropicalis TaxID=1561998 RepID=A0A1I7U1H1_9PELO
MNTISTALYNDPNSVVCVRPQKSPNITYNAAKEICAEMDGKLMPARTPLAFLKCDNSHPNIISAAMALQSFMPFPRLGFPLYQTLKVWMGLERDKVTRKFQFNALEWVVTNQGTKQICGIDMKVDAPYYSWAPNLLISLDSRDYFYCSALTISFSDCAYTSIGEGSPLVGYRHFATTCEEDVADGFFCGTPTQMAKGIPPVQKVLEEYGYGNAKWTWGYQYHLSDFE